LSTSDPLHKEIGLNLQCFWTKKMKKNEMLSKTLRNEEKHHQEQQMRYFVEIDQSEQIFF
jgi:hypothetical protein